MIKSILYLDEPKLFSLSSQILEGITEYLLTETTSGKEQAESQKGPVGSGKTLANAMKSSSTSVERRVLHDYAFSLFEDKLLETDRLLDINLSPDLEQVKQKLAGTPFVRVSAPVTFIDPAKISSLLRDFNRVGEALAYITHFEEIKKSIAELENTKTAARDKSRHAELARLKKQLSDPGQMAKAIGLYNDPKFLENLGMITEFAFADQLELQQKVDELLFSTHLKREHLRESVGLLIRKFSRKTEKSLVVLGLVTQTAAPANTKVRGDDFKPTDLKEGFTNMIDHIAVLESTLSGKRENEVIIDPIAVYVSL